MQKSERSRRARFYVGAYLGYHVLRLDGGHHVVLQGFVRAESGDRVHVRGFVSRGTAEEPLMVDVTDTYVQGALA